MSDIAPPPHARPAPVDEAALRAFNEHVKPEIDVLLRVATSLAGRSGGAEDLVQETLIRAFRAIDSFDGRYPRAWLLTILRRTDAKMTYLVLVTGRAGFAGVVGDAPLVPRVCLSWWG